MKKLSEPRRFKEKCLEWSEEWVTNITRYGNYSKSSEIPRQGRSQLTHNGQNFPFGTGQTPRPALLSPIPVGAKIFERAAFPPDLCSLTPVHSLTHHNLVCSPQRPPPTPPKLLLPLPSMFLCSNPTVSFHPCRTREDLSQL